MFFVQDCWNTWNTDCEDSELIQCSRNTYRVTKKSYDYAIRMIRKKIGKNGTIKDVKIRKIPGKNPFYFLALEICGVSDAFEKV